MPYYDKEVIQQHSKRMYLSAKVTRIAFPVIGALIGGSIGYKMFKVIGAVAGGAGVGYVAYKYGNLKALQIKSTESKAKLCVIG
jgi:hypothetical protein